MLNQSINFLQMGNFTERSDNFFPYRLYRFIKVQYLRQYGICIIKCKDSIKCKDIPLEWKREPQNDAVCGKMDESVDCHAG